MREMATALNARGRKARGRQNVVPLVDPTIAEIIEALMERGGSAHRQQVADSVASARAGRSVSASREIQDEVFAAFYTYLEAASRRRPSPLLDLPLGPNSYRWGVTSAARTLLGARTGLPKQTQPH